MSCIADTVQEPRGKQGVLMGFLDLWQRSQKPVSVLYEATARCNLRCRHCYRLGTASHEEMDRAAVRDVFRQFAAAGVLFLGITGGEPFLRNDILDIIHVAKQNRFFVTLLTNATLVDKAAARELARLGVERVEVSFHGHTAELHDRLTGVPGSFEAFLTGLEHLQQAGLRVGLKSTITSLNVHALEHMKAFAARRSLPLQCDPKVLPALDGSRDPLQVRLDPESYPEALWMELWNPAPGGEDQGPAAPVKPPPDTPICKAGMVSCAVRPSGRVSPCLVLPVTVGDLRTDDFETIWYGPGMEEHRKLTFASYPECLECDAFFQCFRCPAYALLESGDIGTMPSFLCRSADCSRDYLKRTAAAMAAGGA